MSPNTTAVSRRKRPCPVCGAMESKHLFKQSFQELSDVAFIDGYNVVTCRQCGTGFSDGIPTQDVFDAYYRDLSKYEHEYRAGKEPEADEQRFRDVLATLQGFIPSPSARVFEIGCATGRLLSLLKEAGFANVQGLDPSSGCAKAAWDLYKVTVFASSLFDIPAPPDSYDFVILVGVLEHVEDLRRALASIRRILAPGGRVYAEVPDGSRLAGRPDAPYQEFSIEHINFFSTRSLSNLFRANGFDVLSIGEAARQQNENTTCPAAFGVYEKSESSEYVPERDEFTERGLTRYIEESGLVDARIRTVIEQGARGRELLVWGTGTHTQRLLATGAFTGIRIAAFVDSNPKYQGRQLQGIPVLSPASLAGRTEPILISTRGFQREIRDQIRDQLGLANEIILLYD